MKSNWEVKHFSDYHEIDVYAKEQGYKHCHELGCFQTKKYQHHRYYGVFWNKTTPSIKSIIRELTMFVVINELDEIINDGESISFPVKVKKEKKILEKKDKGKDEILSKLLEVIVSDWEMKRKIVTKLNDYHGISEDEFDFWISFTS